MTAGLAWFLKPPNHLSGMGVKESQQDKVCASITATIGGRWNSWALARIGMKNMVNS
jgi:hypothetical protein